MKKVFLIYILIFLVSIFLIYQVYTRFFISDNSYTSFLTASYIYLISFTLLLCVFLIFLQKKEKFKRLLGFLYLFSVPVKIILFIVFFKKQIFSQNINSEKKLYNILTIMILCLFFEVFFVAKILNDSSITKNVE